MSLLLVEIPDNKMCQSKNYETVYLNANYTLPLSKKYVCYIEDNSRSIGRFLKPDIKSVSGLLKISTLLKEV